MAKIVFISMNDFNAEGLRHLSANLKLNGHQSSIIFLKRYSVSYENLGECKKDIESYDWVGIDEKGQAFRYARGSKITRREKEIVLSLIRNIKPDIIGFSVTTPLKEKVKEIASLIRDKFDIPLIWGGADPTINAHECLDHCDFVCVGEGERTIVEIARRLDEGSSIKEAASLAYFEKGRFVQNPLSQLITDLDRLPFKDIDPDGKFLIEDGSLTENFKEVSYSRNHIYHTLSSRGCPFKCTYCCEDFFKGLYSPQNFLRRRSPSNVIAELKTAKEVVDYKVAKFEDEIFSFDAEWLCEFRELYKKEINLPLLCYIYPNKNSENLLRILKDIGLFSTCLALQSGSHRINREVFNRPFSRDCFLKTARVLRSLKIEYYVDVITYNPFEREEDLDLTLDILAELPRPFGLAVNKLYILKGTRIHKLVEDFKKAKEKQISDKVFNYYSRLFWLTTKCNKYFVRFIRSAGVFKNSSFLIDCFFGRFLFIADILLRIRRKCGLF